MSFLNAKVIGKQVSIKDYLKQEVKRGHPAFVIGRSDLCEIAACPFKWVKGEEEEGSEAMAWGTLIDSMLLGGNMDDIAVTPMCYTDDKGASKPWNWNATVCKDWKKQQGARTIVNHSTHEKAQLAVAIIREDKAVRELIDGSDWQVMVTADYKTKVGLVIPVKILIDILPHAPSKRMADLKTTANADPFFWARQVFSCNYHVQSALYLDVYNAATGENRETFLHIIQEQSHPYVPAKRWLSSDYIAIGKAVYENAFEVYAQCLASGKWDGYKEATVIDGFGICQPEAWMITRSGVEVPPVDPTKSW